MNPRERLMAIALGVLLMLFSGAFLIYEFYLVPRDDRLATIHKLQADNAAKQALVNDVVQQQPKIRQARELSLPSDVSHSALEYVSFLSKLVRESGILIGPASFKIEASQAAQVLSGPTFGTKKEPFLTPLAVHLSGRTDLEHLVQLLERFYGASILHRIKSLKISQPSGFAGATAKPREGNQSRSLEVDMLVEGIIVSGTPNRNLTRLASGAPVHPIGPAAASTAHPKGSAIEATAQAKGSAIQSATHQTSSAVAHSLARSPADYAAMLANNIFYGPPPPKLKPPEGPDIAKSIQLVLISRPEGADERGCEAILWNQKDNTWTRLCPKEGRETFQYLNKPGDIRVQGTVVRIGEEDMVFRVGEDLYRIQIDETLDKALARRPLTDSQLRAMKLTRGPGNGGPR